MSILKSTNFTHPEDFVGEKRKGNRKREKRGKEKKEEEGKRKKKRKSPLGGKKDQKHRTKLENFCGFVVLFLFLFLFLFFVF